ncbi:MAG: hypothetical protein EXX96DRAFT_540071 [Benjaminiella poitrasii]|nr:MAG: hypothetical protein EXX96DRAFT_540071 [Benjaminiella poitrasii]
MYVSKNVRKERNENYNAMTDRVWHRLVVGLIIDLSGIGGMRFPLTNTVFLVYAVAGFSACHELSGLYTLMSYVLFSSKYRKMWFTIQQMFHGWVTNFLSFTNETQSLEDAIIINCK